MYFGLSGSYRRIEMTPQVNENKRIEAGCSVIKNFENNSRSQSRRETVSSRNGPAFRNQCRPTFMCLTKIGKFRFSSDGRLKNNRINLIVVAKTLGLETAPKKHRFSSLIFVENTKTVSGDFPFEAVAKLWGINSSFGSEIFAPSVIFCEFLNRKIRSCVDYCKLHLRFEKAGKVTPVEVCGNFESFVVLSKAV